MSWWDRILIRRIACPTSCPTVTARCFKCTFHPSHIGTYLPIYTSMAGRSDAGARAKQRISETKSQHAKETRRPKQVLGILQFARYVNSILVRGPQVLLGILVGVPICEHTRIYTYVRFRSVTQVVSGHYFRFFAEKGDTMPKGAAFSFNMMLSG